MELKLTFQGSEQVNVDLDGNDSGWLPFANPFTEKDLRDIQWYVEVYGAHSLGDPDDTEAARIAAQLPEWGKALFRAVFHHDAAKDLFIQFRDRVSETRLLTIGAATPEILALPWELLHDSAPYGHYIFQDNPRISIRRRVPGIMDGKNPFPIETKARLHLLFVVSRPADAGFLDPRADSGAVLDAIERHAPGRVTWEFLHPPTLDALVERLEDKGRPAVDVIHFDGHGVFDRHGGLPGRAKETQSARPRHLEDLLRERRAEPQPNPEQPPNTGYLLFEDAKGDPDFVSADKLGENLYHHKVALVILSACQTAAVGGSAAAPAPDAPGEANVEEAVERPLGCVAVHLTATGIPAVLAMTHSVLVSTTRTLFGEFYKHLALQRGIGEALDNARRHLKNHPEKYEVRRGATRGPLRLYDWFLPALYVNGPDAPLLDDSIAAPPQVASGGCDLPFARAEGVVAPAPPGGFFGRRRELWLIERWLAGPTRRITLTGFGGQGKSELAREAGRWLTRAGLFARAVFVDYSGIQSLDALAVAVRNIGSVLGRSLDSAAAATAALAETPTLVILDNLEALDPEALRELLDAAAAWSAAGGSRVLCTTRRPELAHAAYRDEDQTLQHRRIALDGLGRRAAPDDVLEWFAALYALPPAPALATAPAREALIELFDKVRFHPLSIRVLTQQLKTRRPAGLGERLEQLLAEEKVTPGGSGPLNEDTPAGLVASLRLSLDLLDEASRRVLPRLGVFQGGAFEDDLLAITEIPEGEWPDLRRQLEAAALIEAEALPGVTAPFLRFHPTLAPLLAAQLEPAERERLRAAHRQRYYITATYLYQEDRRNPHQVRAIAWRELPNLLHAVHAALDAGDPDAVVFAECVNRFLYYFGLRREAEALAAKTPAAKGEPGSQGWFLAESNRGERLLDDGNAAAAAQVFQAILAQLGDAPSFERATILVDLGRCYRDGGRPDLAEREYRQGLAVLDRLDASDGVKRQRAALLTDLADVLRHQGQYAEARKAYADGLEIAKELKDLRQQGVALGQLGTLAMAEGRLAEALERHRAALMLFQQLREPAMEAVAWNQLGMVFQQAGQWDEAEHHFRESARIKEEHGNLAGAAVSWNGLAIVNKNAGKPEAAELWYRKALEANRKLGNPVEISSNLSNLANLLRNDPRRLAEARRLAEESLAISQTLDPGAAQVWKTYNILALIADREAAAAGAGQRSALQAQARQFRRLAREARLNFPGTRQQLQQYSPLILAAVRACQGNADAKKALAQKQAAMRKADASWAALADALDRLLAGQRDPEQLLPDLEADPSLILETILRALANPATPKSP